MSTEEIFHGKTVTIKLVWNNDLKESKFLSLELWRIKMYDTES